MSIEVCIVLDDTGPRGPYIARRGKYIDEANADVPETRVTFVSCKQLAQFGFILKEWLEDLVKRDRTLRQLETRERNWVASLFCDM